MVFDKKMIATKVLSNSRIWRVIIHPPLDGYLNMAIDELLFEEARIGERPPTLRFYQWEGDWVSIGYFQRPERALNVEKANELGVSWVRRPTGGKAVVHSEDLTYTLAAGDARGWGWPALKETYRQVACAIASGFKQVGLPVDVPKAAERSVDKPNTFVDGVAPVPCFAVASDYEITVGGKKLVGSAQYRSGDAFLQHGSIPLTNYNRNLAEEVLTSGQRNSNLNSRYTTIEEAAGGRLGSEDVLQALKEGFSQMFEVDFDEEELSQRQMEAAGGLARGKYATLVWNEGRGDAGNENDAEVFRKKGRKRLTIP